MDRFFCRQRRYPRVGEITLHQMTLIRHRAPLLDQGWAQALIGLMVILILLFGGGR